MGIPVLILGESGSGKSASLRNFNKDEVCIFNVANKMLPFKKTKDEKLKTYSTKKYEEIIKGIINLAHKKENPKKILVIDDSQYLMVFESFEKATIKGYDKFTTMAVNFKCLLDVAIYQTPNDCIVYFLHHIKEGESGKIKAKTVGKMVEEQLVLEGLFSIVLMAEMIDGQHVFTTKSNGLTPVKAPMGMFESEYIDNDLKKIDEIIRNYLDIKLPNKKESEKN